MKYFKVVLSKVKGKKLILFKIICLVRSKTIDEYISEAFKEGESMGKGEFHCFILSWQIIRHEDFVLIP